MINQLARTRLAENRKTELLVNGMKDTVIAAIQSQAEKDPQNTVKMVFQKEEDQALLSVVQKIGQAVAMFYKKPLVLPKIFQIQGKVEVVKQPNITVTNLKDLEKYFKSLEQKIAILAQAAASAPPPVINLPKIDIPKVSQQAGFDPRIVSLLEQLNERIDAIKMPEVTFPKKMDIGNFPPQMIPQPVTNININGLQGFAKSTNVTVTGVLTELPGYGQLFNRRSMIVFNNSSNTTLYLGGSTVTAANGLPIVAQSYSPAIDAGYDMLIYGITAGGSADCRVLEVSKDQTANVQE